MDLGVALPNSAPFASPAHVVRIARAAEEFGYAALWTHGGAPAGGGPS